MKRARFEDPAGAAHKSKISRKVTACQQCQTRKVKCDLEPGRPRCARCERQGLECVVNRSLQTLLDAENEWKLGVEQQISSLQNTVTELQRTLANMQAHQHGPHSTHVITPVLPQHIISPSTAPSPRRVPAVTAMTRENSPETAVVETGVGGPIGESTDRGITDAPMASLFEVTKLRNIRSDPGSHKAIAGQPREPDFIDEGRVPLEQAESLFNAFKGTLNAYLWGGIALTHDSLSSARESSPLLAAAILAVTALHAQDNGSSFDLCYPIFLELVSQSMFKRYHILDDVRGLCIGAFWLSDVSWKLSGLAVRIATELNLHHFSACALDKEKPQHIDKARLWYLLYVCDHHFSIAYGRPPVIPEDVTIVRHESFLDLPGAQQADYRLHSQVAVFRILSRVYHTFGLDRSRLVANDEFESIRRYDADLLLWKKTWETRLMPDPNISYYPVKGVTLHYNFAKLLLFAVCLRGLSPSQQYLISQERRIFIDRAIESASAVLRLILDDSDMRRAIIGVPLYLLTTIAYAAIFLMKVQSEWRAAGFKIAYNEVVSLLEAAVAVLNDCHACARHVAHYLGKGLGAMLVKFKEREAAYQAQQQPQQPWLDSAHLGWNEWMQDAADVAEFYPSWLDVLGSQMPG
ncbi:uncharacterized protein F5Z01DRAFT_629717 [Emericellopsis atlantica]|uniref:Zn(2)-C6 fungal-type domain-containing protein n=1 Tax=Emericellopsis atlantica TaxID=2614577 RepID=A0A9P7ZEN2_9HYPO|nr:uncharacterized protein F5Z01DRAFT_629717 [Emericellopsis atlantica]KAG9250326.1 hypothetical protein F5Z01DRAFT_629717 [Emericellopsis atlantica]